MYRVSIALSISDEVLEPFQMNVVVSMKW